MGNSLAQLDGPYHSHAKAIPREVAKSYFAVMPKMDQNIAPMTTPKLSPKPG